MRRRWLYSHYLLTAGSDLHLADITHRWDELARAGLGYYHD